MIDIVERDTWIFKEHFLPMMERYAYHQSHFVLIIKNETEKDRNIAINYGDVETTRYYAERLKFEFDN